MAAPLPAAPGSFAALEVSDAFLEFYRKQRDATAPAFTTPLHVAVLTGDRSKLASLLARKNVDVSARDQVSNAQLPCLSTSQHSHTHISLIAKLLQAGNTALHHAALLGHIDICTLLLEASADVNATATSDGATPLHKAAQGDHTEVVRLLLSHSADRNALNSVLTSLLLLSNTSFDLALTITAAAMQSKERARTPSRVVCSTSKWPSPSIPSHVEVAMVSQSVERSSRHHELMLFWSAPDVISPLMHNNAITKPSNQIQICLQEATKMLQIARSLKPAVAAARRSVHIERKLEQLGYVLPAVAEPKGNYRTCVRSGNYIFTGIFAIFMGSRGLFSMEVLGFFC